MACVYFVPQDLSYLRLQLSSHVVKPDLTREIFLGECGGTIVESSACIDQAWNSICLEDGTFLDQRQMDADIKTWNVSTYLSRMLKSIAVGHDRGGGHNTAQ